MTVVQMKPKTYERHTQKYDVWIIYNTETKKWQWKVVLRLDPMIFEGNAETEKDARAAVNTALRAVKSSLV